jgi:hypothetical protein
VSVGPFASYQGSSSDPRRCSRSVALNIHRRSISPSVASRGRAWTCDWSGQSRGRNARAASACSTVATECTSIPA